MLYWGCAHVLTRSVYMCFIHVLYLGCTHVPTGSAYMHTFRVVYMHLLRLYSCGYWDCIIELYTCAYWVMYIFLGLYACA